MNQAFNFSQAKETHHSSISSLPFFPLAQSCPQINFQKLTSTEEMFPLINLEQFKVNSCHIKKQHNHKQCVFYHSIKDQRRSNKNYHDEICVFIQNNQQCQLGVDCPFSHNQVEERYMPRNYKKKFCYYFEIGKVENCEYGQYCSYAHSDQEIHLELLHKMKQDENFFIFRFKTVMCPFFNLKHDKGTCVYAHNFQDYRRRPDVFHYELKPCPYWKYDAYVHNYEEGCPYGEKCDKCHGWKEYDFHPLYYKTALCPNQTRCYKNYLCQFYHDEKDLRKIVDSINNSKALKNTHKNNIQKISSADFLKNSPARKFKEDLICLRADNYSEEINELASKSTESHKSSSNHDSSIESKNTNTHKNSSTKNIILDIDKIQVYKSLFYD